MHLLALGILLYKNYFNWSTKVSLGLEDLSKYNYSTKYLYIQLLDYFKYEGKLPYDIKQDVRPSFYSTVGIHSLDPISPYAVVDVAYTSIREIML